MSWWECDLPWLQMDSGMSRKYIWMVLRQLAIVWLNPNQDHDYNRLSKLKTFYFTFQNCVKIKSPTSNNGVRVKIDGKWVFIVATTIWNCPNYGFYTWILEWKSRNRKYRDNALEIEYRLTMRLGSLMYTDTHVYVYNGHEQSPYKKSNKNKNTKKKKKSKFLPTYTCWMCSRLTYLSVHVIRVNRTRDICDCSWIRQYFFLFYLGRTKGGYLFRDWTAFIFLIIKLPLFFLLVLNFIRSVFHLFGSINFRRRKVIG